MNIFRYPLAILMALSLALTPPGAAAASRKQDKKSSSGKVEKRSSPRSSPSHASRSKGRGASSPKAMAGKSRSSHAQRHVASVKKDRKDSRPSKHAVAASRSRSPHHRPLASVRSTRLNPSTSRVDRQLASHSRPSVSASSRDHSRSRATIPPARVASSKHKDDDKRRHHHATASHRHDRSHYTRKHEHHTHDWYRSRGWHYDRDYWTTHRAHRYYNDVERSYIIELNGPGYAYSSNPYGYGYSEPAPTTYYSSYSGYDYRTRILVQQQLADAGYYHGSIDGVIGRGTSAAISRYQYDMGLSVTGAIDDDLLQSLNIY